MLRRSTVKRCIRCVECGADHVYDSKGNMVYLCGGCRYNTAKEKGEKSWR